MWSFMYRRSWLFRLQEQPAVADNDPLRHLALDATTPHRAEPGPPWHFPARRVCVAARTTPRRAFWASITALALLAGPHTVSVCQVCCGSTKGRPTAIPAAAAAVTSAEPRVGFGDFNGAHVRRRHATRAGSTEPATTSAPPRCRVTNTRRQRELFQRLTPRVAPLSVVNP